MILAPDINIQTYLFTYLLSYLPKRLNWFVWFWQTTGIFCYEHINFIFLSICILRVR